MHAQPALLLEAGLHECLASSLAACERRIVHDYYPRLHLPTCSPALSMTHTDGPEASSLAPCSRSAPMSAEGSRLWPSCCTMASQRAQHEPPKPQPSQRERDREPCLPPSSASPINPTPHPLRSRISVEVVPAGSSHHLSEVSVVGVEHFGISGARGAHGRLAGEGDGQVEQHGAGRQAAYGGATGRPQTGPSGSSGGA